eukprot:GHVU01092655.1.p1 GENE.GHVU01092655.1~~GHVU01092655.1.p1  ORF type:complete len:514 (+),score=107.79 GHVU01092655.1:455-1996(+)
MCTYWMQLWSEKVDYERVADDSVVVPVGKEPKMKTVTKRRNEWEVINLQKPIWTRDRNEVKDEDYNEFYKNTFKAYDDPLGFVHFKVEGQVEFSAVLFVPGSLPWELTRDAFDPESRGVRLYVKRVFINDKFTDVLPRWLTFLRGVVDSSDLPLNVGREVLQKSRIMSIINKRIASKAVALIQSIKDKGGDSYDKFWVNFGRYVKVGVIEDRDHQQELAAFLLFYSTKSTHTQGGLPHADADRAANRGAAASGGSTGTSKAPTVSLDDYISRMQPNQTAIYYVAAESQRAAEASPALEELRRLNYEVLYAPEPIDEFTLTALGASQYRGYPVVDANKADLKLPTSWGAQDDLSGSTPGSQQRMHNEASFERFCQWMHSLIGAADLQKVVVSRRLTSSPAVLVQGDFGLSPTMQRYMKQQAAVQGAAADAYGGQLNQGVMELNINHPVIRHLKQKVDEDPESEVAKQRGRLVYQIAALAGGYGVADAKHFCDSVIELMRQSAPLAEDGGQQQRS